MQQETRNSDVTKHLVSVTACSKGYCLYSYVLYCFHTWTHVARQSLHMRLKRCLPHRSTSWSVHTSRIWSNLSSNIIVIIIIKHIYRAHFRGMPQMRWRQQLHVK